MSNGSSNTPWMRLVIIVTDSSAEKSSQSTTNSSPPKRDSVSVVRKTLAQPVGDLDEEVVAGAVAERVVHELEPVEVEEHHDRWHPAAAMRDLDRVRQPVDEQLPVR